MLDNLMSRWVMPMECKSYRPLKIPCITCFIDSRQSDCGDDENEWRLWSY